MTTPVIEKLTDVQSSVVDTISSVKAPVVKGVTVVVDFVIERFPEIPVVPFAEQIPTPTEVINNQFKFAKSVLDTNKEIAVAVAKAAAPITDKALDRKTAKKAAAAAKAA
ncbi:MAG TPA: hypothetical protein VJM33_11275 [Microthrixaceae bacterium]|nr:hypothetical protein [Microthrixaceae bacterium]